jgi:hypothetical protein
MVVVPTSTNVHLTYERSQLDYFAYLLTFIGIGFLIFLRVRGDVQHANTHPFGADSDSTEFQWDDWDSSADETMVIDPTPSEPWQPDTDDPLDSDLSAESLVWASPSDPMADPPADLGPPDANL